MGIHLFAASTQMQKLSRLTMFSWLGIPSASVTCLRRYLGWIVMPRLGFAFGQTRSSVNLSQFSHSGLGWVLPSALHLGHISRPQTKPNHPSFSRMPCSSFSVYS